MINQDNGLENHSRRTQFMYRLLTFAHQFQLMAQAQQKSGFGIQLLKVLFRMK